MNIFYILILDNFFSKSCSKFSKNWAWIRGNFEKSSGWEPAGGGLHQLAKVSWPPTHLQEPKAPSESPTWELSEEVVAGPADRPLLGHCQLTQLMPTD